MATLGMNAGPIDFAGNVRIHAGTTYYEDLHTIHDSRWHRMRNTSIAPA